MRWAMRISLMGMRVYMDNGGGGGVMRGGGCQMRNFSVECVEWWWNNHARSRVSEEEIVGRRGREERRALSSRAAIPPICPVCGRRAWSPGRCGCEATQQEVRGPPEPPGPEDCCQSAPPCEHCVWVVYERERAAWEDLRVKRRKTTTNDDIHQQHRHPPRNLSGNVTSHY